MERKFLDDKWVPSEKEVTIYDSWLAGKYFKASNKSDKPSFTIMLPPPNVTGSLHLGHALEQTLTDIVVRYKRMQGYETLWLPGTDHAAIATQSLVEKQLIQEGTTKEELGREKFLERVWEVKENSAHTMITQMKQLGNSLDWSREHFTMDDQLTKAVRTIFKKLFDAGLIYRAKRIVNWSPVLKTALSDIEVVYKEIPGELVYFKYGDLVGDNSITVATTRVETILGDVAIAVHPDDTRYKQFVGKKFKHPLLDRDIEVVADSQVDKDFGTGAVKITPAHDPNDFNIAERHGLPLVEIFDDSAKVSGTGTEFDGLDRYAAREALKKYLASSKRLVKVETPYMHAVGHSERTGEAVEPRVSLQWWLKVDQLAVGASSLVKKQLMSLYPESAVTRWFDWVDNMHDWCISRQLWWGHRIPIWYNPTNQEEMVCLGPDETPPDGWLQDEDVLDTWFSSGLWPFATLGWPNHTDDLKKFYPNSLLITGYDIIFFWVARMAMFASYISDEFVTDTLLPPFKQVFLHGLVRDQSGKKMSKTKGNVIDPLVWIKDYGADATRFTLARGAFGGADVSLGADSPIVARNLVTKLYNVGKFLELNKVSKQNEINLQLLTNFDNWILDRLDKVIVEVSQSILEFDFGKYCNILYHFFWDEFCDWYLEFSKVQLKDSNKPELLANTRAVLLTVFEKILRLFHPVMPFVTEYLWTNFMDESTICTASWPETSSKPFNPSAEITTEKITRVISELRKFRNEQGIKPANKIKVEFVDLEYYFSQLDLEVIATLAKVDFKPIDIANPVELVIPLNDILLSLKVDITGAIDYPAEIARLTKVLAELEKELNVTQSKLDNENFINKAPTEVVEEIKVRNSTARKDITHVKEQIKNLESYVQ